MSAIGHLLGGIGLFLLGMSLMTDGLRLAAGPALERILASWTRNPARGLATGILVTAAVQSSSAVTVAAIGFVNAGLLTLGQALWVLFGANVGTTVTGWLVALVGLKFKIDALALPLIGIGMALRLTGSGQRRGALGTAIAGFGVLFLGIDLLREAFAGAASSIELPAAAGIGGVLILLLIGILMTVLMQASAAALVIAFAAAEGGMVSIAAAAAVVIGANIGTTVTALIAAIGATPNAKRAAAAHVLFNLLTGLVALLLLPWLLAAITALRDALGMDAAPAATLALFHSVFNILGVALMWPLAGRLTAFLERRFRTAEEDEARPQFLDNTILQIPALALDALAQEIRRMGSIALRMLAAPPTAPASRLFNDQKIVYRLNLAIADFIARLNRTGMPEDSAQRLPELLRVARYYESIAELASEASHAADETAGPPLPADTVFLASTSALMHAAAPAIPHRRADEHATLDVLMAQCEIDYQSLKAALLDAGARGQIPVAGMDARLRAASARHRAIQQAYKAARHFAAGATEALAEAA